jgi:hypothetical protein
MERQGGAKCRDVDPFVAKELDRRNARQRADDSRRREYAKYAESAE